MSTYFQADDKALQDARARVVSGHGHILVLENHTARLFNADETLGYLSWTALLGPGVERVDIHYGHDVPNGFHPFDAATMLLTYREPNGELHFGPVSGQVMLQVDRSGGGFKHTGVLLNVRFEVAGGRVIVLNGTYLNQSD